MTPVCPGRRGYNVLAVDGPGQGGALHLQKLVMRPDWEAVITPVVDYALARREIEPGRIAGFGYSLGGDLLARAAAFEHRLSALVLDDGVHDLASGFAENMPPFLGTWVQDGHDEYAIPVMSLLMTLSPQLAWAVRNGMWVFGVENYAELLRTATKYTLDGVADQILAPTLIMEGEHDTLLQG
jgi:pimeloyl-ACP methyl ester carboxylesterase